MRARLDEAIEHITERVIGAAFEVSNQLGHGFLETVYQRALGQEFDMRGLRHAREERFEVTYKGKIVGEYVADFVVEDRVIVELKAIDRLAPTHVGQVLNYLKASQLLVGLILNFGQPKLEIKRVLAP